MTEGESLLDAAATRCAVTPRSPVCLFSLTTSSFGASYAEAIAVISRRSPRPISTGSNSGASRPWIRYVTGPSSSFEARL